MEKIKILQIYTASRSQYLNIGMGDEIVLLKNGQAGEEALCIKKLIPKLEVECWGPEVKYKKEKTFNYNSVNFRIFPSKFCIKTGMEICIPMLKELKKEIEISKKENKKLILHIHEYHSWIAYLLLAGIKKSGHIKIVAQHHGGRNPLKNLKTYKKLILVLPVLMLLQFFENTLFKKVDVFYPFGKIEEEYLKKINKKAVIRFSPIGIDERYFKKISKMKAREKLSLDKKRKYLLYIGRIKNTKGIKELLGAMREIKEDVGLLIIGGGKDIKKYKEYLEKNKLTNITFLGPIYDKRKLAYLSACDYLILPSYTEGAPVVLMEAIARNLPVIATDVGAISKMIKNGREGLIIKPKSVEDIKKAIKEIIKWKPKDIRKYAEKYKWKRVINDTVKDYNRLFEEN